MVRAFGPQMERAFGLRARLNRLRKKWRCKTKLISGAKAQCKQSTSGTAEAVPLSKTDFFRSL
jgi:hypothetical protein